MNRRRFAGSLAGGLLAAHRIAYAQRPHPPNILFVMSDDHAYQAIGEYGSRINHTPNIDRLASEGTLFQNCLVTNSICAPSRAVILTGKYSHLNGVLNNTTPFDGAQQTFPKLIQKSGYRTALFGKWHLETKPTGFDDWEILPGQGDYHNPEMLNAGGKKQHQGYVTDIITDLALEWLRTERDSGRPFLLMCQHKAPHRTFMPDARHLTMYGGQTIPEPPTLFDDYANRASPSRNQAMEIGRHLVDSHDLKLEPPKDNPETAPGYKRWMATYGRMTEAQKRQWAAIYGPQNRAFFEANPTGSDLTRWRYQRYIKDYLRCVASIDDNLGRILRFLDETGLADNTIVIYTSDQGFYLGEHGWFDKRWMYEESLRTPLIVRWPGATKAGQKNNHLVSNVDFAPTFLQMAGLDVPSDMQGRSMAPLLKGEVVRNWRRAFYYHYYESGVHGVPRHYGVRTAAHKLIRYPETDEWELFDLEKDPHEINSVYGHAAYGRIQQELLAEINRLRKELMVPSDH